MPLPVDIDTNNPDDATQPTVKAHQQHHDALHAFYNAREAQVGLRMTFLWNGFDYIDANGVAATSANRVAKTYRYFIGPSDPNALGLMVNGDTWLSTS